MTYSIDTGYNRFKHYMYKNIVQNSKISKKEFQKSRGSTTPKKIQSSLKKIATCLNGMKPEDIPKDNLQAVCFLVCNTYKKNNNTLGIGPLNDCYIMAQINHKRGYKIYYLYDPSREEFLKYLPIFLKYTKNNLVLYYSGRCTTVYAKHVTDSAIVFDEGYITGNELNSVLCNNTNKKVKIVLVCDCFTGGSIWNLSYDNKEFPSFPSNLISIYPVYNSTVPSMVKKAEKVHGIFTYYLCQYSNEITDISPSKLMERMNQRLERFNISVMVESEKSSLESQPIFI